MGSSLGGYLSIWLQHKYDLPIVAINPAIHPYELLTHYLGEQENPYTLEKFTLAPKHIEELKSLSVPCLPLPEQSWLLQQEGDEVLDYREATSYFSLAKVTLEEEGDHSFIGFERFLSDIVLFLDL